MNYDQIIDKIVREKAAEGATVGEIIFPLKNMIATILANAVVENKLDAVEEIEGVCRDLEDLYEKYLDAYCQQTT